MIVRLYYPKHPYFDRRFSYIAGTDWEFATIRPYYLWSGKRGGTVYAKALYLGSKGTPVVSDVFIGGELDGKYIENLSLYDNGSKQTWEAAQKNLRIGVQIIPEIVKCTSRRYWEEKR